MTFIVTFISLIIERFFDWSHLRRWGWFTSYQHFVFKKVPKLPSYLSLALVILPLLLVVLLLQTILVGVLYGFLSLLFQILLLMYCLGPRNLWADAFQSINAVAHGDPNGAARLQTAGVTDNRLIDLIFIEANNRVFALVFWFVVLGPVGAVLYRTVTLSVDSATEYGKTARQLKDILDWMPIRLFTFFCALGGHFVKVVSCWRNKMFLRLQSNQLVLTECGVAALGEDQIQVVQKSAVDLIDRAFVVFLVVIAVGVLLV